MQIDRRNFISMTAGAAGVVLGVRVTQAQQSREMVIGTYPGDLSNPHLWLAKQLEARNPGLTIRLVPSDSQDIVAQTKAAQGYSPFDAGPNDEPPHLVGIAEQYIAPRKDTDIANLANVYPEFLKKSAGYGVPATYALVGIAYNTNLVKSPPASWSDLWKPEFKGQVGIARTSSNLGLATLERRSQNVNRSVFDFDGFDDSLPCGGVSWANRIHWISANALWQWLRPGIPAGRRRVVSPLVTARQSVSCSAAGRQGRYRPPRQGRPSGSGKLAAYRPFLIAQVEARPDITMPEMADKLDETHGVRVAPSSLSRVLVADGFTYKKSPDGVATRARDGAAGS